MFFSFNQAVTQDFPKATAREWLETNGLGGWASSTIIGVNTRRYHGLLVAATQPPVGRVVLLSKLDETLELNGERFELGCNQFPGAVHPNGWQYLQRFEKDYFPKSRYCAGGIELQKTVVALNGENTTLVLYEVLEAPAEFTLEWQPFVAARDFHSLTHANESIRREADFSDGIFEVQAYESVPTLFISIPGSRFEARPDWYYNFEYGLEQFRGLDHHEDLFTYGFLKRTLKSGDRIGVIISTQNPAGRDAFELSKQEARRRQRLLEKCPVKNELTRTLTLAADQFVVRRGQNLRSLIAGYHWFADWGRDTMIALPGICLCSGRFDDAKEILRAFAEHVDHGMLPNRFPDDGDQPEYNTADAALWFFVAIHKYLLYTKDTEFVRAELMPVLRQIIEWHERGTRYNIHVDEDGLLYAGEPGVQLTWMDAKVGDWVVTPRIGKVVEINALWYNALKIFAELSKQVGHDSDSIHFLERADQVKRAFVNLFWEEQNGYLYDCVDGEHKDAAKRPNQVFALSLPFPLLTGKKAKQVLDLIEEKLLTPVGLRSLSPDDSNYRPHYGGDAMARDSAYHQGTVWSWLLGPYITALVRNDSAHGRQKATNMLIHIKQHLSEAGVGSISEIFDAEAPHHPRGCIAQAWSVGEILRTYIEDVSGVTTSE